MKPGPGRATSAEYTLNVPYFQSGTAEEWLKFLQNLEKVFVGQNLTTSSTKFAMTRRLITGDSLTHFNDKAASFKDDDGVAIEIDDNLETSLRAAPGTILNKKAL